MTIQRIKRHSAPSSTQVREDRKIAAGEAVRYVAQHLKDKSTVDYYDEGPFHPTTLGVKPTQNFGAATPTPGRQALLAALRKQDRAGEQIIIVIEAHVSDGTGGIKVVTGKEIPNIFDKDISRFVDLKQDTPERKAAQEEHLAARENAAHRGKENRTVAAEQLAVETVAAAEKVSGKTGSSTKV